MNNKADMTPEDGGMRETGHGGSEMEQEWERTLTLSRGAREKGFAAYVGEHSADVTKAFEDAPNCVCCMDERVAGKNNGVSIGGSGILIKDDPEKRAAFIKGLKARGIQRVYLHEGCGAVRGVYASAKDISPEQAEAEALTWAKELEQELGGDGEIETLSVTPKEFHNAQCAYIAFTENFNVQAAGETLPPGFVVSGTAVDLDHVMAQVGVAVSIAFGGHGFGDRFTKENPFLLVIVGNTDADIARIAAHPVLQGLVQENGGRVKIDGFVAPN